MGSAQRLTERNILVKFNEYHSMGSGDEIWNRHDPVMMYAIVRHSYKVLYPPISALRQGIDNRGVAF